MQKYSFFDEDTLTMQQSTHQLEKRSVASQRTAAQRLHKIKATKRNSATKNHLVFNKEELHMTNHWKGLPIDARSIQDKSYRTWKLEVAPNWIEKIPDLIHGLFSTTRVLSNSGQGNPFTQVIGKVGGPGSYSTRTPRAFLCETVQQPLYSKTSPRNIIISR